MSEWDDLGTTTPTAKGKKGKPQNKPVRAAASGKWNAAQTIVAFFSVTLAATAVAWLTRNVESRPIWMLACCFAVPVLTLMASVMLVEKVSNAMTPQTSRGAQMGLAAATVVVAGLAGLFCQVTNVEAQQQVVSVVGAGWQDAIIVMDKSGSMFGTSDTEATEAVRQLLAQMDDSASVGFVAYDDQVLGSVPMGKLTGEHKQAIMTMAQIEPDGGTNFSEALAAAMNMIQQAADADNGVSIIFVTDGFDNYGFTADQFLADMQKEKVTLNYIRVGDADENTEMTRLAAETGGKNIQTTDIATLKDDMVETIQKTITRVERFDALRDIEKSDKAKIVMGLLLALLGILIGVTLTIMFSRQGQKRAQLLISPLMAVLAFVILTYGKQLIPEGWLREAIAFSCFGVVVMKKNAMDDHFKPVAKKTVSENDDW